MGTYAANSDIVLDTGRSILELLSEELSSAEQQNVIRNARERGFNRINSKLRGKTAVPAFHIPVLKQVEVDYVLSDILVGAFTGETMNISEWAEKYKERADEVMDVLVFEASAEDVIVYRGNTGNGRLTITDVFSEFLKSEVWSFTAITPTTFSVEGTITGRFPDLTVDVGYPEKDWYSGTKVDYGMTVSSYPVVGHTPFSCRINAGSTPFVKGDNFSVRMFASAKNLSTISTGVIVRA